MSQILFIGDPHIKMDNSEAIECVLLDLIKIILDRKPILVVILGDILHTHDKINVSPLVRAINFLERLREVSPHLVILIGNHDRPNNADFLTDNHPFTALKSWSKTTIVDVPTILEIEDFRFLAVPYVYPGRLLEAFETIGLNYETLDQFSAIFLHQEILGCQMGPIISEIGDPWPNTAPIAFSGHIHDFNILQDNFIYVGTPIQHNFGDSTDKAVMLATFSNKTGKYISYERIKLNVLSKVQIRLTVEELLTFIPPERTQLKITILGDPVEIRRVLNLEHIKLLLNKPGIKYTICDTRPEQKISLTYKPIKFYDKFRELSQSETPIVQKICRELGLF